MRQIQNEREAHEIALHQAVRQGISREAREENVTTYSGPTSGGYKSNQYHDDEDEGKEEPYYEEEEVDEEYA